MGGVDVVLLHQMQCGEGEEKDSLSLLSNHIVLSVETDHVVHTDCLLYIIHHPHAHTPYNALSVPPIYPNSTFFFSLFLWRMPDHY